MGNTHLIDGGRLKCSCKGGGCKSCNATTKQVARHNDIMQFGLDKQTMLDNLQEINEYMNKIEAYTMYQYLTKEITKEQLDEYVTTYAPKKWTPKLRKKSEIKDTSNLVNPNEECVYDGTGVWARCKFCNSIYKYHKGQKCLRFIGDIEEKKQETLGTTVVKNEISNEEKQSDINNQTEEKNNEIETPKKKRGRKKKTKTEEK